MKLFFRLFWLMCFGEKHTIKDVASRAVFRARVLPTDLDLFGHMNNGRYLMLMDLARIDFARKVGLFDLVVRNRWVLPVGRSVLDFQRPLKLGQPFEIETTLVTWDRKWMYLRQEFREAAAPHRVVGCGYVKVVIKGKQGTVRPDGVIAELLGQSVARPKVDPALSARFGEGSATRPETPPPAVAANPSGPATTSAVSAGPSPQSSQETETREPIAIVGVGCRLPGGVTDATSFWEMLGQAKDCIVDIPDSRWNTKRFFDPDKNAPGRMYVQRAGILQEDLTAFDPGFFGISPREAEIMDPQQRMLLETTWEAFEDAGIPAEHFSGSDTGVYVGGFTMDNMLIQSSPFNRKQLSSVSVTSSTLTMLSNRLSFTFDLRGPSMTIDTACSSSLVGLHQACRGIWQGESGLAVVAGVNAITNPEMQINMTKGQFLSPRGRCNTFGDGADGYTRAEGSVSLILKPLSQAQADNNPVYAVIRGTAVNQDGRTNGITNPSRDAQIAVMQRAYREAGVVPADVAYVEAHGTGTAAGDPVEAGAIGSVMQVDRDPERPLLLGSVKTNLGHTEAASGVTGVLKAALCLKHGQAPAHIHLEGVNPNIDLAALHLRVPKAMTPLSASERGLFAGVNSFGYGGTNAHAVLAAPPAPTPAIATQRIAEQPYLLPLSARSASALTDLAQTYASRLEQQDVSVHDLCYSAGVHRSHHRYRLVVHGMDRAQLIRELRAFSPETGSTVGLTYETQAPDDSRLVFVYTGMGPQWWGMGRELYQSQPVFRESVDACDAVFQTIAGWSVRDAMLADEADSRMERTEVAQPANAVLQIALTRLWASWGIRPDAMVGHSVGEVPAAYLAGALTLEDAMLVSYHRSRLQQQTAGQGGMLAVGLAPDEAREWVQHYGAGIAVAAVNSDQSVTLAGDQTVLQAVEARLQEEGRFSRFLKVEVPYHSPVMDQLEAGVHETLASLQPTAPTLPLYSTVTGARVVDEPHDHHYWWRNVRGTVFFAQAVAQMLDDGYRRFVEIGPHPVLATSMRQCFQKADVQAVSAASLNRKTGEWDTVTTGLAKLYCWGTNPDWGRYNGPGNYIPLPRYPWQKQTLWRETETSARYRLHPGRHPLLGIQGKGPGFTWETELSLHEIPYLADHVVSDAVLFPGAGYLEMALAAHAVARGESALALENVKFLNACSIKSGHYPTLHVQCDPQTGHVAVHQQRDDEGEWQVCATARCFAAGKQPDAVDLPALQQRLGVPSPGAVLYRELAGRSLDYGPRFQGVQQFWRNETEVLAEIHLHEDDSLEGYHLHPTLLDACFHSLIATVDAHDAATNVLPVAVDRYRFFAPSQRRLFAHGRVVPAGETTIYGHIQLMDAEGVVFAEVTGLTCKLLPNPHYKPLSRKIEDWGYVRSWQTIEAGEETAAARWLILPGDGGEPTLDLARVKKAAAFNRPGTWMMPTSATNIAETLASLPPGPPVYILDGRAPDAAGGDPVVAGTHAADRLLQTIQALPVDAVSRYFLVTRDAEQVADDDRVGNLAAAPLVGLARTLMSERPDLKLTLLDLSGVGEPQALISDDVVNRLAQAGAEQELALRDGRLHACRMRRAEGFGKDRSDAAWTPAAPGSPFMLQQAEKGNLESMRYIRCDAEEPGPGQVLVEVVAVPLGFKDVMKTLGILSDRTMQDTFYGNSLGMESAGVVRAVGDDISDLAVGDRVACLFAGSFRSHLYLNRDAVAKIPENLDFAEGANLIAFLTVWYGLFEVARLQKGERILIHGAAGGVGLAAVEVARMAGAEIYATAGSAEKRDYLTNVLGLEYVSHSRTIDFVDEVRAWTGGQGVDVVINYTPGEIMVKSLHLLRPMGRFIEIGKTSFEDGTALSLHPFMENLLYASVDFDRLMAGKPDLIRRMYGELMDAFAEGRIKPSPNTVFTASQTVDAFRFMARGRHIGKVVVEMRDDAVQVLEPPAADRFKEDRTYLITGGLGGFGLQVAQWAAGLGARNLALVSRRGAQSEEAQHFLRDARRRGLNVQAFACDVSDGAAVQRLITDVKAGMPPLAGVVHGAMVLDDKSYDQLDRASLEKVMGPKALGAWHLHEALQKTDLDFMVFFSSISSVLGNAGQGNYVAANAFLDQLAYYRRGLGLPAQSINWGVFDQVGVVARNRGVADHLSRMGITPFSNEEALAALGACMDRDLTQVGMFDVHWQSWAERILPGSGEQRLAELLAEAGSGGSGSSDGKLAFLQERFGDLDEEARAGLVTGTLMDIVAKVLRVPRDELDVDLPLLELGTDSIMSMEIVTLAEAGLGIEVSAMDVVSGPPIRELADGWTAQINTTLSEAVPAEGVGAT